MTRDTERARWVDELERVLEELDRHSGISKGKARLRDQALRLMERHRIVPSDVSPEWRRVASGIRKTDRRRGGQPGNKNAAISANEKMRMVSIYMRSSEKRLFTANALHRGHRNLSAYLRELAWRDSERYAREKAGEEKTETRSD